MVWLFRLLEVSGTIVFVRFDASAFCFSSGNVHLPCDSMLAVYLFKLDAAAQQRSSRLRSEESFAFHFTGLHQRNPTPPAIAHSRTEKTIPKHHMQYDDPVKPALIVQSLVNTNAHHCRAAFLAACALSPVAGDGNARCGSDREAGELIGLAGDDSGESNRRTDPGVLAGGRRFGVTPADPKMLVALFRIIKGILFT